MGPSAVVEGQIPGNPGACHGDASVGPQVDFLIFDAPPQTLDEDVVAPSPLAIHADFDLSGGQHLDEVGRGKLTALIHVEDLGRAVFRHLLLHSVYTKVILQRDRHPLCQDFRVNQFSTAAR